METLARPRQQVTQAVDRDPVVTLPHTLLGRVEWLMEGLRMEETGQLFLRSEPSAQRLTHRRGA
jgi:hypothetical protein